MPEEVPCTDGLEVSIEDLQPAAYDGTSPSSLLLTADTDTHTALASSSMLSRDADIPAHQLAHQPQAGGETGVGSAQQTHVPAVSVFNSAFYASPALPTPGAAGSSTQEAADKAGSSVVPMVFGALSIGPQSSPPKEGALMPVGRSVTLAHALQAQAATAGEYVRKEYLSTAMQPAGTVTPSAGHLFANHHRPPIRGASLSTDRMMRAPADKPVSTLVKEQSAAEAASAATARDPSRSVRPCGSPALQRHPPARGASLTAVSRMARELPLSAVPRMGGHLHSARQAFGLQPLRTPFASSGCAPRSQELQWTPSGGSDESGLMRPQSRNSPLTMSESYRQRPSMDDGGAGLHRAIKHMVLSDEAAFLRVQASLRGISSLAKETDKLQMARDPSGATCMNQYVVIKTLGKGSFGKVRLCLNTLDGKLRAIKMVDRALVLRQLQRAPRCLRRRAQITNNGAASPSPASFTAGQAAAAVSHHKYSLDESRESSREYLAGRPSDSAQGPSASPMESIMREVAVLKRLDHPNVVKLLEIIDCPTSPYIMLVMEFLEGGPILDTCIQGRFQNANFSEDVALDYFRQVCQGLDYLHYNNVVHGDLKPENLLTTADGVVKIGDFGSSRIINDARASSKISSTPAFQPPEALQGTSGPEDPFAADVWSLGVCLYCFVYGRLPFMGSCTLQVSKAIMEVQVEYPADVIVSAELLDLFKAIFVKDPTKRITLEGAMSHPWTTGSGLFPLRALKSQLSPPEVIQASRLQAIDAIDRSPLVSMIRAKLKERTYQPGEYLYREHQDAHCVYMIMSGLVELIASKPVEGPLLSHLGGSGDETLCIDLEDSFMLDCPILMPTAVLKDGKLHIDRAAAEDIKQQMSKLLMGRGQEYVTEVRGPGQVIGEVSFTKANQAVAQHQMSARAKEAVVVVELTESSLRASLKQACGAELDSCDNLASVESIIMSHYHAADPHCDALRDILSGEVHQHASNMQPPMQQAAETEAAAEIEVVVDTL